MGGVQRGIWVSEGNGKQMKRAKKYFERQDVWFLHSIAKAIIDDDADISQIASSHRVTTQTVQNWFREACLIGDSKMYYSLTPPHVRYGAGIKYKYPINQRHIGLHYHSEKPKMNDLRANGSWFLVGLESKLYKTKVYA